MLGSFSISLQSSRPTRAETSAGIDSYMEFSFGLTWRPSAGFLALVASLCLFAGTSSQAQQASLDPSDIWYRGYLLVQEAEEYEKEQKYLEAFNKLGEAKPHFDHLVQAFPEYMPEMVKGRRHMIAEKRDDLKQKHRMSNATPRATPVQQPQNQNSTPISPPPVRGYGSSTERSMEIEDADSEFALPSWTEGESQVLPRVAGVPGMPRVSTPRPTSVGSIARSLNDDLEKNDDLIQWLTDENLKLRTKLKSRENLLRDVNAELVKAQADRVSLMQRIQQQEGIGGAEAEKTISTLKDLLRDATDQLESATTRNAELVAELESSRREADRMKARISELENEVDNLLAVVKGEGTGGKALKELMDRNRELSDQLDRAEKLAGSLSELNAEKDKDIAMLKSEIAKIKLERDQLISENQRHQKSIDDLQEKLQMLSDGLTAEEKNALANADPIQQQEIDTLRTMVLNRLRQQAKMKQAKELLLQQLERVGARSETLLGLVEDMARGSQLTAEEKALIKTPEYQEILEMATSTEMSGEFEDSSAGEASATLTFVAPGVPGEGTPENPESAVKLTQLEKAARLDFKEGRYKDAEEGFLEFLRYRPRSVPCLCNLGVLKIATKEYSKAEYYLEKALALEEGSGLANYLLGRTYFLQDKLDDALEKLEVSLTYDSQNAKAHNCVGVISTRKGWVERAKRAFGNAVTIDPEYGDAHFNLAVLYSTMDQPEPKEAERHYFRALHLGVPRDASIEEFLKEFNEAGLSVGMR